MFYIDNTEFIINFKLVFKFKELENIKIENFEMIIELKLLKKFLK